MELSADIVRLLVLQLLTAYADRNTLVNFVLLQERIEDALVRLRQHGATGVIDEVFCEGLTAPDNPTVPLAIATLVRRQEWFSPAIVSALLEALPYDHANWDWPIDRCLKELVTPEVPKLTPRQPIP